MARYLHYFLEDSKQKKEYTVYKEPEEKESPNEPNEPNEPIGPPPFGDDTDVMPPTGDDTGVTPPWGGGDDDHYVSEEIIPEKEDTSYEEPWVDLVEEIDDVHYNHQPDIITYARNSKGSNIIPIIAGQGDLLSIESFNKIWKIKIDGNEIELDKIKKYIIKLDNSFDYNDDGNALVYDNNWTEEEEPRMVYYCYGYATNDYGLHKVEIYLKLKTPNISFYHIKKIEKIELNYEIEKLIDVSLQNCEDLKEIVFPKGLKVLESSSLAQCRLKKIIIPDGVERIESCCFRNIGDTINISFPSSLKYIGHSIFIESAKERVVIWYDGTIEQWNAIEKDVNWANNGEYIDIAKIIVECSDGYLKYNF